jgi:colanic acid biosynthesis glycosyl transferase WcaI
MTSLTAKPLRILVVTQYFRPEAFRVNDLVDGLRERGHSLTVLTGLPNYQSGRFAKGYGLSGPYREHSEGVDILRVPLVARGGAGTIRLALNYLSFAFFATLLGPMRCRSDFDAIFVFEISPITAAIPAIALRRLRGAPLFLWVQDLWPESVSATGAIRAGWILRWVERLVRFIYRHSDEILVQSMAFVPKVQQLAPEKAVIRYFPNWAEPGYQPVRPGPSARAELPSGFRIVFAGNIGVAQSFETILAAATLVRENAEIQWVVFGDGRRRPEVERRIVELGLSATVRLMGRRPAESMPEYLALADVLLVTLQRDPIFALTIPSKIQSYLACAKPILAALDGEGARIVREAGAGLVVAAEDASGLAESALRLFRMSGPGRDEMGRSGRRYFESHFCRANLLDQLEGWMKQRAGSPA